MENYLIIFAGLACSGVVVGFFAGLLGIGGGFVTVPVLFYVLTTLKYPAENAIQLAIATSLTIIIFTGISSGYSHYKSGNLKLSLCKKWCLWIIGGSIVGSFTASIIDGNFLKLIFGVFTLILAFNMLRTALNINFPIALPKVIIRPLATLGAFISSWIGIGGGVFNVPLLLADGKNIYTAVGTSAAFGIILAVPASLVFMISEPQFNVDFIHTGYVVWPAVFAISPISMLSAPVGAYVSRRLNVTALKIVFSLFLFTVALNILFS